MNAYHIRSVMAALTLIGIAVLAFVAIHTLGESSGVASVLSIAAGMASMAALDFFSRSLGNTEREKVDLDLNHDFLIKAIAEAAPQPLPHSTHQVSSTKLSAITARRLLLTDPQLALAKLRIELEEALLALTDAKDAHRANSNRSLFRLAENLIGTGTLPANLLYPIKQVSEICNLAIHGADIPPSKAAEVVDIGEALIAALSDMRASNPDIAETS